MWDREATRYSLKLLSTKRGGLFVYRNKTDINSNGFMPRDMIVIK